MEWASRHQNELLVGWELVSRDLLPPTIEPLE